METGVREPGFRLELTPSLIRGRTEIVFSLCHAELGSASHLLDLLGEIPRIEYGAGSSSPV